jgi:hypothetical protein
MLVSAGVVGHQVNVETGIDGLVYTVEKRQELLVAVPH